MVAQYGPEDLAYWADSFNNVSDFIVTKGSAQLVLGSRLAVRDSDDDGLEREFLAVAQGLKSPYSAGSLADDVWRVQTAAETLGVKFSFDDTPWGLAGVYLADAMDIVVEDAKNEALVAARRKSCKDALDDGAPGPLFQLLLAQETRRRSATSALAAMFSAQEAAFFEAAEWYQLPIARSESLSRKGFPSKWTAMFAEVETNLSPPTTTEEVEQCFQCRHQLVHVPPRIRRTCTPDNVLIRLLPSNAQLERWICAMEALLKSYFEQLDLQVELPSWSAHAENVEFRRRLREDLPVDDLLSGE